MRSWAHSLAAAGSAPAAAAPVRCVAAGAAPAAPAGSSKSVAIIGGGMAGLMCATKLRQLGVPNVVVFDTGKNAVGGRMSSRDVVVRPKPGEASQPRLLRVDHSAQLLSASTPRFQRMLDHWQGLGLIQPYPQGAVGTLDAATGGFAPRGAHLPPVYHPTGGMRALAEHLAEGLAVQRPVWVGRVQRRDPAPGAPVVWDVFGERSKHLGAFDFLVIAHNGKCADRLMSTAQAPALHALLRTKFTPAPTQQQVMQMCSLWVCVLVFPSSLKLGFDAAFVEGHPTLSFLSNNTARLKALNNQDAGGLEAWTLISTRQFGTDNKVPQEAIPPAKEREVTAAMLDALSEAARLPRAALQPCFTRLQLWGAAVPLNVTDAPCVFDAELQAGIAGDWLVAPSLEGAALSGVAMAERIAAHAGQGAAAGEALSVGLGCRFKPTQGPPLGAVPMDLPPAAALQGAANAPRRPPAQQQQREGRGGSGRPGQGRQGGPQEQQRPTRPASGAPQQGAGTQELKRPQRVGAGAARGVAR